MRAAATLRHAIARSSDGRHLLLGTAFRGGGRWGRAWRGVECLSANAAVMRAEALSRKSGCAGAVAFSRTGDPSSGDFGDAKVIRKFGEVPDELSTL